MAKIVIQGDCLVTRATELHQILVTHLNETADVVDIDLSSIGRCDLTFFQLICAAQRSFSRKRKCLKLCASLPVTIIKQFEEFGLTSVCGSCPQNECPLKEIGRQTESRQQDECGIKNRKI